MPLNVRSALLNHGYKVTTVVDGVGLLVGGWRILDRADALCRRFRSALARIGTLEFFTAVLFGQRSEGLPGGLARFPYATACEVELVPQDAGAHQASGVRISVLGSIDRHHLPPFFVSFVFFVLPFGRPPTYLTPACAGTLRFCALNTRDAGRQLGRQQTVISGFCSQLADRRHADNNRRRAEATVFERYPPRAYGGLVKPDRGPCWNQA